VTGVHDVHRKGKTAQRFQLILLQQNGDPRVKEGSERETLLVGGEDEAKTQAELPPFAARSVSGAGNADFFSVFLFPLPYNCPISNKGLGQGMNFFLSFVLSFFC
jgi:hypothetical protein